MQVEWTALPFRLDISLVLTNQPQLQACDKFPVLVAGPLWPAEEKFLPQGNKLGSSSKAAQPLTLPTPHPHQRISPELGGPSHIGP